MGGNGRHCEEFGIWMVGSALGGLGGLREGLGACRDACMHAYPVLVMVIARGFISVFRCSWAHDQDQDCSRLLACLRACLRACLLGISGVLPVVGCWVLCVEYR